MNEIRRGLYAIQDGVLAAEIAAWIDRRLTGTFRWCPWRLAFPLEWRVFMGGLDVGQGDQLEVGPHSFLRVKLNPRF